MVKKVREYKSGDFIFAKVKGYPAWPARVQGMNGKKYYVLFYGTGETANLPPTMIFDYAENKDKFLTKSVKRRHFVEGVKQIEHDIANNVPLEQVPGINLEAAQNANDTANDSAINETMDESMADDTADESAVNTTQNETGVEDSDDTGALVIDEGKPKGKKSKVEPKTATPAKPAKEPKTPRGRAKKDDQPKKEDEDEEKKEEEIVSRSGRKIRPKRYMDEQIEDNVSLPSPAPKKRRGVSPAPEKEVQKEKPEVKENIKVINSVPMAELEDLKEPFKTDDPEKDNILMAYLPSGRYIGVKLFQSRPTNFKSEASRLQWDRQAAANAITLKTQLENGLITAQSVITQLVMDLNLTDEEKATLDKERETDEKKSRVQFLKTEMKLIELDAKIKTCLSLEKADTELCLKLLDELIEMDVKPLMLLKHPTCLETVKRMRAYVGNTPSWDLSESAAILFSKQAHRIRKQADTIYKSMKELFTTPEGLSFWEFFSERVLHFKKVTANLSADELLELVHEPLEMSVLTSHTMKSAVEAANEERQSKEEPQEEEPEKKKSPQAKTKKANNNVKTPGKRQSSRKVNQEEKDKVKEPVKETVQEKETEVSEKQNDTEVKESVEENAKEPEENNTESETDKEQETTEKMVVQDETEEKEQIEKEADMNVKETESESKENEDVPKETENVAKEAEKTLKENDKSVKDSEESKAEEKTEENKKEEVGEPRAKRSREVKKTETPPPRSPAKRKVKA